MSAGMYTKSGFNTCFFYLHGYNMSLRTLAKQSLLFGAITSLLMSAMCCKYNTSLKNSCYNHQIYTNNIMSGYLPIIKQQLELEATSESLLNPELNLAVGVIVCNDQIKPLLIHQDFQMFD